jgi:basic membrane protein A
VRKQVRYAAVVLAVGGLVLTACGDAPDDNGDAAGGDYRACMVTDVGGIDDRSFNESAWAGLQGAAAQSADLAEPANVSSGAEADYVPNLEGFVGEDCEFILAVGVLMADATAGVAEANPDRQFGIVDAGIDLDNVYSMQFDTAQAAFLAGYLAAGYSESGVVATYGGVKVPSVTIFMDGFVDGVAHYNEVEGADVEALGWDKEEQTGAFTDDFEDQAAGRSLSDSFVAQGADVILPVAGGAGLGTAAAAADSGGEYVVIWVDVDGCESVPQYCSVFLTTVVKNIPDAVSTAVLDASTSDGVVSGDFVGTLENRGVSLAPYHEFEEAVGAELATDIIDLQADIIEGTVTVTSPAQPR